MFYVLLILAIVQSFATYNFCKVPESLPGFFLMYTNFCAMFFTFLVAFIMLNK